MTKAAVAGLTKGLARDLGPRGITVNNVQPGPTDTDMNPASSEFAKQAREYIALQRYAHTDEIADFVAHLASPGASFIHGCKSGHRRRLRSLSTSNPRYRERLSRVNLR